MVGRIQDMTQLPGNYTRCLSGHYYACTRGDEECPICHQLNELQSKLFEARKSLENIQGDNLCWITDPEKAKALPEAEFMESCRRYRNQIAAERGEVAGAMTIAQLETALATSQRDLKKLAIASVKYLNAATKYMLILQKIEGKQ